MSDSDSLRNDPISALLELEGDSAVIVPDSVNGYDRVIPEPSVLKDMQDTLCAAVLATDIDHTDLWNEMLRNEKSYEAMSDEGETITIPVSKTIANQQIAWVSDAILSKSPIITVKPLDGGSYEIPANVLGASDGQPVYQTTTLSAEDAAKLYQSFIQFKLTECIDFGQLLDDTLHSIHAGESPTWWKITYDPKVKKAKQHQYVSATTVNGKRGIQIRGVEETDVRARDAVMIEHVFGPNVTMPITETDEQTTPWLCEKTPMKSLAIWEGIKSGRFDLCLPDGKTPTVDDIKDILGFADDLTKGDIAQTFSQIDLRVAEAPTREHDVRTLWFYHPIKRTETSVGRDGREIQSDVIEVRSLCATVHVGAKRFLNCYVNPYWHGKRPYVPFFQKKRPHRFSGYSAAGDIAPLQRLISQIFNLQINNGVQQNVKVFPVRENSATHRFLTKQGGKLRPGMVIPFEDRDDINPIQLGAPVVSMAPEITFLSGVADRLAVQGDYDYGTDIPNRTPAATVAQVESLAKVQPKLVLRQVRRKIAKAIEMYLQTIAQFHQYETIPFLDDKTNRLVSQLIAFPRETIENHFSFHVTATGDEDSPQAKIEKATMALNVTYQVNEEELKLSLIFLNPQTPPPAKEIAMRQFNRIDLLYADLISALRPDSDKFRITEDDTKRLTSQVEELAAQAAQKAAEADYEQGPQDVQPGGAGGNVSELPPGPQGPGPAPAQSGDEGMALQGSPDDLLAGGSDVPVQ